MSGKCFTYFYSFNVSSLQPSEVGTICLSLASKESRTWSRGFRTLLYSGCNSKEAGVREKRTEARKGGESWWRCVIKLVPTKCDWLSPLTRLSSHETILQKTASTACQSYRKRREEWLIYHFSSAPWEFYPHTYFRVGKWHTSVSAGKPQESGLDAGAL